MKKTLLFTTLFSLLTVIGYGQFTIGSTSLTYSGNPVPQGTSAGQFYSNQPNNDGGTFYSENTCTTAGTQGSGPTFTIGGFDPNVFDATTASPAHSTGIIFYGGGIRTVYYGASCEVHSPSFGFHTGTSTGIASGTDIDLSLPANQKIQFTYQSSLDLDLELQLFDETYSENKLSGATVSLLGDNAPHTVTIDFSGNAVGTMSNVRQVSLVYASVVKSGDFATSIGDIQLGSAVVNSTAKAMDIISGSKVYPNPASDFVTVEINLTSLSHIKVTITDLMGKQVAVVAEGNVAEVNQSFDVSSFAKGMYTVNYFVNSAPVKAELLFVK